jgi:hypothetical protein
MESWTIEALVYPTVISGSNRSIVGRDGCLPGGLTAPLYFNIQGSGALQCSYIDQAKIAHTAQSAATLSISNWYYVAVTCDGTTLKLWMANLSAGASNATQVASQDVSGSSDPNFGPWPNGSDDAWSVFRGYYNGGHVDRFFGNIDEVRITASALDPNENGLLAGPSAPTGLLASASSGQIDLSWAEAALATGYNVKRTTTGGGSRTTIATNITGASYTDSGLANGTVYYYVVSSLVCGLESSDSAEASARPLAPDPAALGVSAAGGSIHLTWPADHTGWKLQTTTNLIHPEWTDVEESTATNAVETIIDPGNNTLFFRIVYP